MYKILMAIALFFAQAIICSEGPQVVDSAKQLVKTDNWRKRVLQAPSGEADSREKDSSSEEKSRKTHESEQVTEIKSPQAVPMKQQIFADLNGAADLEKVASLLQNGKYKFLRPEFKVQIFLLFLEQVKSVQKIRFEGEDKVASLRRQLQEEQALLEEINKERSMLNTALQVLVPKTPEYPHEQSTEVKMEGQGK